MRLEKIIKIFNKISRRQRTPISDLLDIEKTSKIFEEFVTFCESSDILGIDAVEELATFCGFSKILEDSKGYSSLDASDIFDFILKHN